MRASVEGPTALVIDAPAQSGNGIPRSPVTTKSPPHQSAALTASPQGEAYAIRLRWGDCYGSFLHKPCRVCQSPSPGGPTVRGTVGYQINFTLALKVGRPEAGSDEGERRGSHGVGNRRTHPPPQPVKSPRHKTQPILKKFLNPKKNLCKPHKRNKKPQKNNILETKERERIPEKGFPPGRKCGMITKKLQTVTTAPAMVTTSPSAVCLWKRKGKGAIGCEREF